jgi:hypothetical protein
VPSRARVHDVLRIAAALLAVVAITYQLARLQGHPSFGGVGNFFSFFTIQSNVLAAAALVLAASSAATSGPWASRRRGRSDLLHR